MDIEFKEGAVCFADGKQWYCDGATLRSNPVETATLAWVIRRGDFQLNTIKQGDYIEASEPDTEQKYNDAVEVFGLFGFERGRDYENTFKLVFIKYLKALNSKLIATDCTGNRKLTYPQLMAIGELKRLELERDKEPQFGKNEDGSMKLIKSNFSENPNSCEDEWTDRHYDFNYQLTKEDIEKGHVRVDAYFVNRMWKINQWDDTGAAFHVLKTLPRIANNKNPLKRELVALKKQVNLLCKMHGVDGGDLK